MRKLTLSMVAIAVATAGLMLAAPAPTSASADPITFNIDPRHSSVEFRVRHLGLSRVTGRFEIFEGTFKYDPDDPTQSSVSVTIDTNSLNTGVQRRDNHLRSADFLEVEKFPTMTFESTSVRVADAPNLEIVGNLTIHGVTKEVTLEAEFLGMAPRRGGQATAFEAHTRINRHDYGLVWNRLQEGLQLVGDNVDITIQIEANTPREN